MKNILSRADTLQQVGERLRAQYGDGPIPIEIIRREVSSVGGYKESSVLPSDFCYNYMNLDPVSMTDPMFVKVGAGLYRYLGRDYPYSGPVLWKPKGEPERVVGEWINGRCNLANDPRQKNDTAKLKVIPCYSEQDSRQVAIVPTPIQPRSLSSADIHGVIATEPNEKLYASVAYDVLWERIEHQLSHGIPNWKERIEKLNQVSAVQARADGHNWSDDEVFKGLVLSILSSNTDWAKIENILPELDSVFCNFRLLDYSALEPANITQQIVPWFKNRRAGSQSLGKSLTSLINAAGKLLAIAKQHGSLEHYFKMLVEQKSGDIPSVAMALGGKSNPDKLPGLGIPLATEFLKNIGYDVAKPDRHINRAAGSFGWVTFKKWPEREGTKPPTASEVELIKVMRMLAEFAAALTLPVCYVDNAIWLLCAKSGLYLDNRALACFAIP